MRGNLKSEIRMTKSGGLLWLALVCFVLRGLAQEELPKLRPPKAEIPPTFWEQHGATVMVLVPVGLLLVAVGLWLLLRPKPPVPLPPEVRARTALEALLQAPEDGQVLSRVSQILRRYVQAVFALPPGEPTTAEFCQCMAGRKDIGEELSGALADFLRRCDARKFAQTNPGTPLGAAARALELVAQGEARRAVLRAQAAGRPGEPVAASA